MRKHSQNSFAMVERSHKNLHTHTHTHTIYQPLARSYIKTRWQKFYWMHSKVVLHRSKGNKTIFDASITCHSCIGNEVNVEKKSALGIEPIENDMVEMSPSNHLFIFDSWLIEHGERTTNKQNQFYYCKPHAVCLGCVCGYM